MTKQNNVEAAKKLLDEEGFYILDKEKVQEVLNDIDSNRFMSSSSKDNIKVSMETLFLKACNFKTFQTTKIKPLKDHRMICMKCISGGQSSSIT